MGRLLAAKAHNELSKYVRQTPNTLCDLLQSEVVVEKQASHGRKTSRPDEGPMQPEAFLSETLIKHVEEIDPFCSQFKIG